MARRDTTRALALALGAQNTSDDAERQRFIAELVPILRDMDARTGRRDPSVRGKKAPAVVAKAAKKAGARRR